MQSDYWDRPAFETIRPRRVMAPLVFNSSHSGRDYPERFLAMTRLDHLSTRQSEDAFVDELFQRADNQSRSNPRSCYLIIAAVVAAFILFAILRSVLGRFSAALCTVWRITPV